MSEPIPKEQLDRACRALCRRVASAIIHAMAETDTSVTTIAYRLGKEAHEIQKQIDMLICGESLTLENISDILFALDCEVHFSLVRRETEETTQ